jgi:hypothetical protein
MKRIIAMLLAAVMVMGLMAACGAQSAAPAAPTETAAPETEVAKDLAALVSADTNDLLLYVDGADVTDGNVKFEQIKDKFSEVELDDVYYYATPIKNLCAYDLSSVQAFFGETTDGFVRYYKDLENAYIAVLQSEDGETYTQIENEGAPTYAMVLPEGNVLNGITNVFMMSKAVSFSVPIQVNGEEIGQMTLADFMKKTPVGDAKVTTGLFDGSFKYKFGEATYRGRFLGIDFETFVAKLAALEMPIEGTIKEVEFYGINGLDKEGKNTEYALYPDESNYFANTSFIVMYDGMVNNPNVKDIDLGLTAFINGSGQKWITYNLTAINFITE